MIDSAASPVKIRLLNDRITACYLYFISKYGYPPPADDTERRQG